MDEDQISIALVCQKDEILQMIDRREYVAVADLLSFNQKLWEALDYGYKTIELAIRLLDAMASDPDHGAKIWYSGLPDIIRKKHKL